MQLALPKKEEREAVGTRKHHELISQTLPAALAAFLFAQCRALETVSPFCVCFAAAVPFSCVPGAVFGAVFGCFLAQPWATGLKYAGALLLTALFRLLLERRFRAARGALLLPVVACCSVLSAGLAALAFETPTLFGLAFAAAEAALAFVAAALFYRALRLGVREIGLGCLGAQDLGVLMLSCGVFLMCGASLTFGKLSIVRVAACLLVLFAAQSRGVAAGALAGVCAGAAFCVDPSTRFLLGYYAIGGLCAGVFASLGQSVMCLFFVLSGVVCTFVSGADETKIWCLGELLIGGAVFFLLPGRWLDDLRESLKKSSLLPDDTLNRPVASSLRNASSAVRRAAEIVCETGRSLDRVVDPEIHAVFAKLQQNICYGCGFKNECWSTRFGETSNDILILSGVGEGGGAKTALEARCPRASALKLQIEQSYGDFVSGMAAKTKVKEVRGIVGDQFSAISVFLNDLADQVAQSRVADHAKAQTLKSALEDHGVWVDCLQYFTAANGRTSIEITMLEDAFELDREKLRRLFERMTGRSFASAQVAVLELRTTLTFYETAAYAVLCAQAQIPMAQHTVCGDSVRIFSAADGLRCAVLSDGMGTGARAAVDSELTVALTERLVLGGFSFPCALQMVNSALLVKSTDESIATFDAVAVNSYTAEASFFKAGAAVSFLRRGDQVHLVEEASMPLGILRRVDFAAFEAVLSPGDIILLVSDGVTAGDCGWINDELLAWSTNNMEDLAMHIASLARLRSEKETADDISVAAVKLMKGEGAKKQ